MPEKIIDIFSSEDNKPRSNGVVDIFNTNADEPVKKKSEKEQSKQSSESSVSNGEDSLTLDPHLQALKDEKDLIDSIDWDRIANRKETTRFIPDVAIYRDKTPEEKSKAHYTIGGGTATMGGGSYGSSTDITYGQDKILDLKAMDADALSRARVEAQSIAKEGKIAVLWNGDVIKNADTPSDASVVNIYKEGQKIDNSLEYITTAGIHGSITSGLFAKGAIGLTALSNGKSTEDAKQMMGEYEDGFRQVLSTYNPNKIESLTATAFSFALDAPLFEVGGSLGKGTYGVASKSAKYIKQNLIKSGVKEEAAEIATKRGFNMWLEHAPARSASSAGAIGTYDALADANRQMGEGGVDNFDWTEMLKELRNGMILGTTVGVIGQTGEYIKGGNIISKSAASRNLVSASAFAAENTAFVYGNAILDDNISDVTWNDWVDGALTLYFATGKFKADLKKGYQFVKEGKIDKPINVYNEKDAFLINNTKFTSEEEAYANKMGYKSVMDAAEKITTSEESYKAFMNNNEIPATIKAKIGHIVTGGKVIMPDVFNIDNYRRYEENGKIFFEGKKGDAIMFVTSAKDKVDADKLENDYGHIVRDFDIINKEKSLSKKEMIDLEAYAINNGINNEVLSNAILKPYTSRTNEENREIEKYRPILDKFIEGRNLKAQEDEAILKKWPIRLSDDVEYIMNQISKDNPIDNNVLNSSLNKLYDKLDKTKDPSDAKFLEDIINEFEGYENITEVKTARIEQGAKVESVRVNREKPKQKGITHRDRTINQELSGEGASNYRFVLESDKNGLFIQSFDESGKRSSEQRLDAKTVNDLDIGEIYFDKEGNVSGIQLIDKSGRKIRTDNPEIAIDYALEKKERDLGGVSDAEFNKAFDIVTKEYKDIAIRVEKQKDGGRQNAEESTQVREQAAKTGEKQAEQLGDMPSGTEQKEVTPSKEKVATQDRASDIAEYDKLLSAPTLPEEDRVRKRKLALSFNDVVNNIKFDKRDDNETKINKIKDEFGKDGIQLSDAMAEKLLRNNNYYKTKLDKIYESERAANEVVEEHAKSVNEGKENASQSIKDYIKFNKPLKKTASYTKTKNSVLDKVDSGNMSFQDAVSKINDAVEKSNKSELKRTALLKLKREAKIGGSKRVDVASRLYSNTGLRIVSKLNEILRGAEAEAKNTEKIATDAGFGKDDIARLKKESYDEYVKREIKDFFDEIENKITDLYAKDDDISSYKADAIQKSLDDFRDWASFDAKDMATAIDNVGEVSRERMERAAKTREEMQAKKKEYDDIINRDINKDLGKMRLRYGADILGKDGLNIFNALRKAKELSRNQGIKKNKALAQVLSDMIKLKVWGAPKGSTMIGKSYFLRTSTMLRSIFPEGTEAYERVSKVFGGDIDAKQYAAYKRHEELYGGVAEIYGFKGKPESVFRDARDKLYEITNTHIVIPVEIDGYNTTTSIRKGAAMSAWYGLKNKETADIVFRNKTSGWTEKTLEAIDESLTQQEKDVTKFIAEFNGKRAKMLERSAIENGIEFKKVDYYMPRSIESYEMDHSLDNGQFNISRMAQSIMKERKNHNRDLKLESRDIIMDAINYNDMADKIEFTKESEILYRTLMGNKAFTDNMKALGLYKQFDNLIRTELGYGTNSSRDDIWHEVNRAIFGFQKNAIWGKPLMIPKQASSAILAIDPYASLPSMAGKNDAEIFAMFNKDLMIAGKSPIDAYKWAYANSEKFRMREDQWFREQHIDMSVPDAISYYDRAHRGIGKISRAASNLGMLPIRVGDASGIVVSYKALYDRARKEGMSHEDAMKLFEKYDQTQQSASKYNKTMIQLSPSTKSVSAFASAQIGYYNKVQEAKIDLVNEWVNNKSKYKNKADFFYKNRKKTYKIILYRQIANGMFSAVSGLSGLYYHRDDKDKWDKFMANFAASQMLGNMGMIPIVGVASEQLFSYVSAKIVGTEPQFFESSEMSSELVEQSIKHALAVEKKVKDDDIDGAFKEASISIATMLSFKYPYGAMSEVGWGAFDAVDDIIDKGYVTDESIYEFGRAAKGGTKKKKKATYKNF